MIPLNRLMNYSAELSQSPSFFRRNFFSRFINAVALPIEFLAILENALKLPYQTATLAIKIPAKVINVVVRSKTLKEFESHLASPSKVINTAFKIVGYIVGHIFTLTLGMITPFKNFNVHCALDLVTNEASKKTLRREEEKRKSEIAIYEKVLENRLRNILDSMRQTSTPETFLMPEQLQEIENLTKVPCPSIEELVKEAPIPPKEPIQEPTPPEQKPIHEPTPPKEEPIQEPIPPEKEPYSPPEKPFPTQISQINESDCDDEFVTEKIYPDLNFDNISEYSEEPSLDVTQNEILSHEDLAVEKETQALEGITKSAA